MILEINPLVDIVFKKLFASPEHGAVTMSFVNALLERAGLPAAKTLQILNPFQLAEFKGGRAIEVDILYADVEGRQVQLDIQLAVHAGLTQRMLRYWAQLYAKQAGRGEKYGAQRPVISIWILDKSLFRGGPEAWFHNFKALCDETGVELHGDFRIVTIELEKWRALLARRPRDTLSLAERWLYLLALGRGKDVSELLTMLPEPEFKEAVEVMIEFVSDEHMQIYYRQQANQESTIASYIETGFIEGLEQGKREGLEEGIKQGIEQGIEQGAVAKAREIAFRMKALSLAPEAIAEATGLSLSDIAGIV